MGVASLLAVGVPMAAEKPPRELVEGVDYYVESGRWVFTAAFHRARGACCQSGCRHCPWGYAKPTPPGEPGRAPGAQSGEARPPS